jgi:ankyrin repeat protein
MWEDLKRAIEENNTTKAVELIKKIDQEELNNKKCQHKGKTALHFAAEKGMREACELLVPKMSSEAINAVTISGHTTLILAASKGMKEVCELLIPKMTPEAINAANKDSKTALYFAAYNGHKEVCELLIPKMSPEAINIVYFGSTVLHYAASKGMKEVCELLIPKMTLEAINAIDYRGNTALHLAANTSFRLAANKGKKEVCELLIPKMTLEAINAVDKEGKTALHHAASGGNREIFDLVFKVIPEAINAVTNDGYTTLHIAAEKGMREVCELLITKMSSEVINSVTTPKGFRFGFVGTKNKTALHFAAEKGMREVCELLITKMSLKAFNTVTEDGQTTLHFAAAGGNKEIFDLVFKMNPEAFNIVTNDGQTTLHFAAAGGNKEIFDLVFKMNPEAINAVTNDGYTALHFAAKKGTKEVCELLIPKMSQHAINANTIASYDKDGGYTALHLASSNGHKEVCELLILKMSQYAINAVIIGKYDGGKTALHFAAKGGHKEVCELLIPKMSLEAINAVTTGLFDNGKTAADFASSHGHREIVDAIDKAIKQLTKPESNHTSEILDKTLKNTEYETSPKKILSSPSPDVAKPTNDKQNEIKKDFASESVLAVNSKFEQLLTAIKSDDTTGVQKLIIQMNKQELSTVDDDGKTALHWAAEKDNEKVAKLLLAKKPDLISIEDKCENTALVLAVLFDSEKVSQLLSNFTGKGLEEYNEESYWYEYSKDGINKLLALRLDNSYIDGVKIVDSVLWSDSFSTIEILSNEIVSNLGGDAGKILVPLNLYGKHWVGIAAEKSAGKINLIYMDSEQQEMPALLREQLTTQIAASLECQVSVTEPKLELQKFNNCGVEMIENFLLYLTGCRLSQEIAVEFHSRLLEEDLTIGQNLPDTAIYNVMEQIYLAGADTQFHVDHG